MRNRNDPAIIVLFEMIKTTRALLLRWSFITHIFSFLQNPCR